MRHSLNRDSLHIRTFYKLLYSPTKRIQYENSSSEEHKDNLHSKMLHFDKVAVVSTLVLMFVMLVSYANGQAGEIAGEQAAAAALGAAKGAEAGKLPGGSPIGLEDVLDNVVELVQQTTSALGIGR